MLQVQNKLPSTVNEIYCWELQQLKSNPLKVVFPTENPNPILNPKTKLETKEYVKRNTSNTIQIGS